MSPTVYPSRAANLRAQRIAKRRRLTNLRIAEVSGVDHPANAAQMDGAEGWLVMKNAPSAPASSLTPAADDAWAQLRARAGELRRADPSLSEPQSISAAAAQHPHLVAAYSAAGAPPLSTSSTTKALAVSPSTAWAGITAAAERLRKADSTLTEAQAVAKAAELLPEYVNAYAAR